MSAALDRFGHVDTLVNNAAVFISKPFTECTAADYALITGVNLGGFRWLTRGESSFLRGFLAAQEVSCRH